ncbi:AAA family ATPase [Vibrio rotiferianus]|uniref:AAA family ATPase n=1 Tax=Vibrio rotiferianus TaxID=190895 RepID=UPI000B5994A8|nr:MoxR family ATPase [Vibrio rotiferianus]ASI94848.1 AAA family ATPase [Vibrio rotiferianus]
MSNSEPYNNLQRTYQSVCRSVIGQEEVIKSIFIGLLVKGHVLLEGLPGTAKTRSIQTLAKAINAQLGRVQFTPDLLPSDVTGSEVYREVNGKPSITFEEGPIFNQLVLADEVNRAPAKVQAALLEAMAERTVTVAGQTHNLPELFLVLATQNPLDQEGTYPLPEAQLDRFLLKVNVDFPSKEAELDIIRLVRSEEYQAQSSNKVNPLHASVEDVLMAQKEVSLVRIAPTMEQYIVNLITATRYGEEYPNATFPKWLEVGVSPRASIALDKCARAHAWLDNRDYVEPDDIRAVAHSVLGHRLTLNHEAMYEQVTSDMVIDDLLTNVSIG